MICDDEELIRWSLREHLEKQGYVVSEAEDGRAAIDALESAHPDLILLDLKMPRLDGLGVLSEMRQEGIDIPVIVITAFGGLDSAIESTKLGARGYLTKPFDLREVGVTIHKTLEEERLRREVHYLRQQGSRGYGEFIGTSQALTPVFETLRRLEQVDAPTVLVLGESGTGKDVVARMIHQRGKRADGPFLEIDCAALPENLIESELFGHEKGAFTDAKNAKPGLFELAKGGVVFLDEIGEMPIGTQAKLLRALESRTFRRVGGVRSVKLDAALIAATNRNLLQEVEEGRFREDLYFRLHVVPISLPPLRERRGDVPALVDHFLTRFNRSFGRTIRGVSLEAMERLEAWAWPGNVRELRNVLERITILGAGEILTPDDLPPEIRFARGGVEPQEGCPFVLPEGGIQLEAVERGLIHQALDRTAGNQSAAARLLGISRYALRYRMEKYELNEATA